VVKGNAGASPGCGRAVTVYESNLWESGQRCSSTDVIAPPSFVADPAVSSSCTGYDAQTKRVTPELCWRVENHSFDYHLAAGSPAIGRARPEERRATDIDGQSRPLLSGWDMGSDQREPASIEPGKAIGAVRLGMPREAVEQHYGRAVAGRAIAGGLRLAHYRARGNRITVYYDAVAVVVGIRTRSRYYSTPAGFGVGSRTSEAVARGLSWIECFKAIRTRGRALTLFHSSGGPTRGRIGLVSIVAPAVELPDLAKRCEPPPSPRAPSRR
jgi:hypothetical protein